MKAYVLLRTRCGTSRDIAERIRKLGDESFVRSNVVYGWYDVIVEREVTNATKLTEFVKELRRTYPDISHIGTAIEKTSERTPIPLTS